MVLSSIKIVYGGDPFVCSVDRATNDPSDVHIDMLLHILKIDLRKCGPIIQHV